jgi:HAD superfamily hydrolase (TIGR01509 family)
VRPLLVIFDCDGVLVDSEVISNEVLARALAAQGLQTTLAQTRRDYQGLLLADILALAQERLGRPLPEGWLAQYERDRTAAFRRDLKAVPEAGKTVERIVSAGSKVCVASQGKLEKTKLSLELTGLTHLFAEEELFSAYSVARGKPHPDLFLHAASSMDTDPSRCVVVEDSRSGVQAAVSAGMRVLGYTADSDPISLQEAGAELLATMSELPGLLGLG